MENNFVKKEGISKGLMVFNVVLVALLLFMFFVIYGVLNRPERTDVFTQPIAESKAFDGLELEAKSAYVFDVNTNQVLYKKNEFVQLPLASITKLMTALTAVDLLPKNSKITIRPEFLAPLGDSGLVVSESWTMKELLDFSLMVSSNDGVRSIASVAGAFDLQSDDYTLGREDFVQKMNQRAKDLGLQQTYFINESGLDEGGLNGGYGSAIDVARLTQYLLVSKPDILEATRYQTLDFSSEEYIHEGVNTNIDIPNIPGLLASKTGFTNIAGGNLVIAFDASIGRPIIVVVLGSSVEGRFKDISSLVNASLEYIRE